MNKSEQQHNEYLRTIVYFTRYRLESKVDYITPILIMQDMYGNRTEAEMGFLYDDGILDHYEIMHKRGRHFSKTLKDIELIALWQQFITLEEDFNEILVYTMTCDKRVNSAIIHFSRNDDEKIVFNSINYRDCSSESSDFSNILMAFYNGYENKSAKTNFE